MEQYALAQQIVTGHLCIMLRVACNSWRQRELKHQTLVINGAARFGTADCDWASMEQSWSNHGAARFGSADCDWASVHNAARRMQLLATEGAQALNSGHQWSSTLRHSRL